MPRIPGNRKAKLPADIAAAEENFMRCPKGHKLPNRTNQGECTPLYCATTEGSHGTTNKNTANKVRDAVKAVQAAVAEKADATIDAIVKLEGTEGELAKSAAKDAKVSESAKLGQAAGRHAARKAFLAVPDNLTGTEAEGWADRKLIELLPLAVAEKEYQLKFGDDASRDKAATDILNANGRGKKEGGGNSAPTIILVGSGAGGGLNFPWLKRKSEEAPALPDPEVVDAKE